MTDRATLAARRQRAAATRARPRRRSGLGPRASDRCAGRRRRRDGLGGRRHGTGVEAARLAHGEGDGGQEHQEAGHGDGVPRVVVLQGDDRRQHEERDQVHHLDERVEGGTAVSLNGSPTVSPMTAALCASQPLPPWWPSSMYFLALSHAPPALVRKFADQLFDADDGGEEAAGRVPADAEPDERGVSTASRAGRGQLAQRGGGADVDDGAVLRALRAGHDPAVGELPADLLDHHAGGAVDGADGEGREEEGMESPMSRPMNSLGSPTLICSRARRTGEAAAGC